MEEIQTEVGGSAAEEAPTVENYVAPEVAAALRGEQVDFGKDLLVPTDETDTDTDA